ncbi:flagellar motor protein MotA [Vibrio sp. UCD-FRSSP16_10]|uniref:MotA/TolQ/ExbB proton channel family protein n=1 Tax=unclassified Vibrio TaxID=2614977 RepID=UPI0008005DBA|nr:MULTISPECIES: MotA/TolQ/ExbB proton channel family protein [unclassified Vibrio]OBT16326.1 flagellar motor protein MotA [Vibrio sp. UCD-FRSSP16_30]OBT21191.1 flagellar motor protein MotA [Vibrio sp. UCD-FRSSP16_10]
MKHYLTIITLAVITLFSATSSYANQDLLQNTAKAKQAEQQQNKQREQAFKATEQQLKSEYKALLKQRNSLNKSIESLSDQFDDNEQTLAEKEKQLTLATGSLGEIFGVVRQGAKDVQLEQERSVASIGLDKDIDLIHTIIDAKSIPSKAQLYGLWHAYENQITNSAQATLLNVPYVNGAGEIQQKRVLRMGAFALADEHGYLTWDPAKKMATSYIVQPSNPLLVSANLTTATTLVTIDASRGALLEQLANNPTIMQRIEQGGIVGKIIISLLGIGLLIGVYRSIVLVAIKSKINKQLKQVDTPKSDNPLGRIILVHQVDNSPTLEALELRLLEAVMDEQEQLDKGISTVKLLAAIAPMLGLLGTVTGMIDTFQTITQFGNADPRIMAGGISMALITTVLGLVAAMPLLLVHNMLSSLSESIRNIIEKQGVGLVAESAERQAMLAGSQTNHVVQQPEQNSASLA